MTALAPPFRRATPADAPALADFMDAASEGLAPFFWQKAVGPDGDAHAHGAARMAARAADWIVAEEDGAPVAGLNGYAIPAEPEPVPDDMEPMFVPLQELENLAVSSWHVHVLATRPDRRGHGWGARLLAVAEAFARAEGLPRMSIIVADNNTGARRLYDRTGYAETARRPMVRNGWQSPGSDWILLLKSL